jgi:uncharacterized protein YacL
VLVAPAGERRAPGLVIHLADVLGGDARAIAAITVALLLALAACLFVLGVLLGRRCLEALGVLLARRRARRSVSTITVARYTARQIEVLDVLQVDGQAREVIAVDRVHGTVTVRPFVEVRSTRFGGIYRTVRARLRRNPWGRNRGPRARGETLRDRA